MKDPREPLSKEATAGPGRPAPPVEAAGGDRPGHGRAGHSRDIPGDLNLATLAKAVGHPARVGILRFLRSRGSASCGEIVTAAGLAQSTVSRHLQVLKDAGLVDAAAHGASSRFTVAVPALARLIAAVTELSGQQ